MIEVARARRRRVIDALPDGSRTRLDPGCLRERIAVQTSRMARIDDEILFGWDPTPGIVSVWADNEGRALVWRRMEGGLVCERERFRPWLLATSLDDVAHLGDALAGAGAPHGAGAKVRYRELTGEAGDHRFLLAASSGRELARIILSGASRRLARQIRTLAELPGYYRTGAVEQYLMSTGRVYFRDLHYDDLHRLQIDLETTSLDPDTGRIFLAAVRDTRGLGVTLEAPSPADERRLLEALCALVRERDPDVIENHNLFGFDLPFLERRAEVLDVPLALGRAGAPPLLARHRDGSSRRRARYAIAGRELIDTLDAVRRHDFVARDLPSHRLKDVARHFGVAGPDRVYLPGAQIHATHERDPDLVRRYALGDVTEVDALSRRLLRAPFALAGMAPRSFERVASAGPATGILEPILVRAYLRARRAIPGPPVVDAELGPHAGGALHLFATGVAERVVKADIASLYPSLMRAYRIGPACDRLGALLHVVERMLDLRLAHKAAARDASISALDRGHHEAMQAAMKLLINSAYGYMGAGSLALFADRRAADEVTRRGRAILDQLVGSLRARGVALIEADTDGVYFGVPEGFTELDERAIVAAVGAELPAGIRLEYEGRYRAMFSHEVKNYALLTYGGDVVLRGAAMRSSRSEPFGDRFLREALRRTMLGDTAGLRAVFEDTVSALVHRTLPVADVATRARLTKSPEAYRTVRAGHREAPYEALLAAGRTRWAPGDRVRYYRAAHGYVWLPDEDDDDRAPTVERTRDYDVEHYTRVLVGSYVSRLRKAFASADFARIFRLDGQVGLFDGPMKDIAPLWIRCPAR
ncbi:DNA polymerase II [Minicystis rosea]|nr:DNA polymerase II [Minicystis rosea]